MTVYDLCVSDIKVTLRAPYLMHRNHVQQSLVEFSAVSSSALWCNLPRIPRGNPSRVLAGTLTKQLMIDLYDSHLVGSKGKPRDVYDQILVAAGGLCPFCAGVGQTKTLDHYLPKSSFPLYSTAPANLIPCCRDCNTGRSAKLGTSPTALTLHPYFDNSKFFEQRWVSASISSTTPIVATFYCSPPNEWSDIDKGRVEAHFQTYDLAGRYRVQAGAEIPTILENRSGSLKVLSNRSYKDFLIENASSPGFDVNGWQRTLYDALSKTDWFLECE